jgi:hypothetical protein
VSNGLEIYLSFSIVTNNHIQDIQTISSCSELKFAAYMYIGTHLIACGWFLLACASLSVDATDPNLCKVESWALQFSETPLSKIN